MDDKLIVELVNKTSVTGAGTGSSKKTTSKPSSGGGNSLIGMLGKVAAGIGIITNLLWSVKPILKVIGSILKMVGAFLQPLAEVIILLLRPILILLRPIVQAFHTMMQPFMDLIRQAGVLANYFASQKNYSGLIQTSSFMMQALLQPLGLIIWDSIKQAFGFGSAYSSSGGFNGLIDSITTITGDIVSAVGGDTVGNMMKGIAGAFTDNELMIYNAVTDLSKKGINTPLTESLTNLHGELEVKLDIIEDIYTDSVDATIDHVKSKVEELNRMIKNNSSSSSSKRTIPSFEDTYAAKYSSPYQSTGNVSSTIRMLSGTQTVRDLGDLLSSLST